jgi:hypothetical protein
VSLFTRQQLCAELQVSESTVMRLEALGLPYTLAGARAKRYDLPEVKAWLKTHTLCPPGSTKKAAATPALWQAASAYTANCRKVQLRVMPS